MSEQQPAQDDPWAIVEPGVIALPTTGYEIRYERGLYMIYRNGVRISCGGTLAAAKSVVRAHMRDLLAMGLEP